VPAPVINIAQMRAWEQATWDSGQSVETVMRLAGRAVANAVMRSTQANANILVLAGKGNNGGDAKFAAEYLEDRDVRLLEIMTPREALNELRHALDHVNPHGSLIVDGLFGIGLNRELSAEWIQIIEVLNCTAVPILSVDVPSGLNADTGEPMGAAIRATQTVSFGAPKTGLVCTAAAEYTGRLLVAADIGLTTPPPLGDLVWTLEEDFNHFPLARPTTGHKGTFGHLAFLSGSCGYHGAAVLAARAALRAMPGLVSVFPTPAAYPAVAAQLQQVMVHPLNDDTEFPASTSAVLIGPGLAGPEVSESIRARTRELWISSPLPVIVDASALAWLPCELESNAARIITPHPGEAARLLNQGNDEIQHDRVDALRRLSVKFGNCSVVLKGHQTLVGGTDLGISINSSGNALLGQGGSGDVLAGYLGGLLAQPLLRDDLSRLIRYAVWEHGAIADRLAEKRAVVEITELISQLGNTRSAD
jgi:ADP-dependent NAD(P)H-hydrate dehydratase / NAD(P)H-hydrate epimerase